jgi:hypothetical protein
VIGFLVPSDPLSRTETDHDPSGGIDAPVLRRRAKDEINNPRSPRLRNQPAPTGRSLLLCCLKGLKRCLTTDRN